MPDRDILIRRHGLHRVDFLETQPQPEADAPVVTPAQAGAWSVIAQVVLIAIVFGCLTAAFIQIVLPTVTH